MELIQLLPFYNKKGHRQGGQISIERLANDGSQTENPAQVLGRYTRANQRIWEQKPHQQLPYRHYFVVGIGNTQQFETPALRTLDPHYSGDCLPDVNATAVYVRFGLCWYRFARRHPQHRARFSQMFGRLAEELLWMAVVTVTEEDHDGLVADQLSQRFAVCKEITPESRYDVMSSWVLLMEDVHIINLVDDSRLNDWRCVGTLRKRLGV